MHFKLILATISKLSSPSTKINICDLCYLTFHVQVFYSQIFCSINLSTRKPLVLSPTKCCFHSSFKIIIANINYVSRTVEVNSWGQTPQLTSLNLHQTSVILLEITSKRANHTVIFVNHHQYISSFVLVISILQQM